MNGLMHEVWGKIGFAAGVGLVSVLTACTTPSTPDVSVSPTVTPLPSPPRSPSPTPTPTPTPDRDLRTCAAVGGEYRTVVSFETRNYFVNICQQGSLDQFVYVGQEKNRSTANVQVPAFRTQQGYRATNGSTTYNVEYRNDGWTLEVLQDGQLLLRERDLNAAPINSNNPRPPQPQPPGPGDAADPTLYCTGGINDRALDFSVRYTQESGFTAFEVRDRATQRLISQGSLRFEQKNAQGEPIYRGNAGGADVTVIGSPQGIQTLGSQMSFSLDGQWGRGTCRPRERS